MKFAADFPRSQYEAVVREDMKDLDPGSSGAFSVDHTHMIRRLKVRGKILKRLFEHDAFLRAIYAAYDAHANVCEADVGK